MRGRRTWAILSCGAILSALLPGCRSARSGGVEYPDAAVVESRVLLALPSGVTIHEGGFGSSMVPHPSLAGHFYLLTDRGPNAATERSSEKRFPLPGYVPRIGLFKLEGNRLRRLSIIELKDASGRGLSGLPNRLDPVRGETAIDLSGKVLHPDTNGVDSEGLAIAKDGTFWISDEYGPVLLHVDAGGRTLERIGPFGRNRQGRSLPRVLATRRANHGMEGLTLTPDGRTLVGLMQSALDNPSAAIRGTSTASRLVTLDLETGRTRQFLYLQELPDLANSEIAALSESQFLVLERDDRFAADSLRPARVKRIYRIDTSAATDVSDPGDGPNGRLVGGKTMEQLSREELRAAGIVPVAKTLLADLLALADGYPHDKPEGLAVLDREWLAVCNDDDFGVTDGPGAVIAQKVLPGGGEDRCVVRFLRIDDVLGSRRSSRPAGAFDVPDRGAAKLRPSPN